MKTTLFLLIAVLVAGMGLAACMPVASTLEAAPDPQPTGARMAEKIPTMGASQDERDETPSAAMNTEETMAASPAWFGTELTDVVSGETFRIQDFHGKVVLVETFAQWCPTCLRQQQEIVRLHDQLGMPADLVTINLDIDPNEDVAMLEKYLEKHGFDWHYAIAPVETAREIGQLYGDQFLNPPSAPMFIIDRSGVVHPLAFGVKSSADLEAALQPFLEKEK